MRTLLLKSLILLWCLPCVAQEYNYVHYDTEDGLAGSVVFDMVQDQDGFLWFATETGVSRYDGTRFKNFTMGQGLPDNEIIGLLVDSRNRVWMIPFSNAICYYHNGTIYNKHNDSLLRRLQVRSFVRSIIENQQGDIAIVQDTKISILKKNGELEEHTRPGGQPFEMAAAAGIEKQGVFKFALSQAGYVNIYEHRKDSLHLIDSWSILSTRYPIHFSNGLRIITNQKERLLHIIADSGSADLPFTGFLKTERFNDSLIINCWSTHIELYNIYRLRTERIIYSGKNVNDFIEDTEGNWWFSSMGSGVYRLPSTEIRNYFFKIDSDVYPVSSLEKYKDTLYVGADNFRLWTVNLNNHQKSTRMAGVGRTPGRITAINRMHNGILMLSTEMGLFTIPRSRYNGVDMTSAIKSAQAYGDTLLIGTSWAGYEINSRSLDVIDTFLTARNTSIWRQGQNVYYGTLNGLYVLDKDERSKNLGTLNPALAGKISVIRGSADGTVWVGTHGNGVIGLWNDKIVAIINAEGGLTSNTCRTIFTHDNVLWVGTDKGLNKVQVDGKKITIKKYTVADGLASDIINAILHDGKTIYVATPAGITYFDEEKVFTNSICRLMITGIQSSKQQWPRYTSGMQFGHYENNIRIEFVAITFKSGGDIVYRYKLNGLDNAWHETRDNFLNYLSLPSGDYELELMATNKFGVQSETLRMNFSVAKLIWEKSWFRALVVILVAAAVWLFVRYRIRSIRLDATRKMETDKKIAELEQMALKAQMNPHFIFNSLHSIQQYVIDKDVAGANKYITDFARLIRLTLDISSQPKISLADEINYISTYLELEKAKYEGKFSYEVETAPNINVEELYIPAMLLQPYIENSIRHGIYHRTDKNGLINIDFHIKNEYLVCTIEDNGVGRKISEQLKSGHSTYQSKGMMLTARRIDMLNQEYGMPIFTQIDDVINSSKEISGTRVILRFPINEVRKQV